MGHDITNENGEYFRASIHVWPKLLSVAVANGWEPEGTSGGECEYNSAAGGYDTNEYQEISADDGLNLADALKRGIETGTGIEEAVDLPATGTAAMLESIIQEATGDVCVFAEGNQIDANGLRFKMAQAEEFFRHCPAFIG